MPHMVIFRDAEGRPGYHQSEALEDAVRFVEHLRNEQQVGDAWVFSMQEVSLEFKSYWRVSAGASPAEEQQPVPEVEDHEPEAVPAGAAPNGRFGLFGR